MTVTGARDDMLADISGAREDGKRTSNSSGVHFPESFVQLLGQLLSAWPRDDCLPTASIFGMQQGRRWSSTSPASRTSGAPWGLSGRRVSDGPARTLLCKLAPR